MNPTDEQFDRLLVALTKSSPDRLVLGIIASLFVALTIGSWSILYSEVKDLVAMSAGRSERIATLEILEKVNSERYQEILTRFKRLEERLK